MTGRHDEVIASIARDVRWAMDALHANEPVTAERILARAWESFVLYRESKEELASRDKQV